MSENTLGQIGDFFAEVQVIFNFDQQYQKIQEELRRFAASLPPIYVPIKVVPPTATQVEMAAMEAQGFAMGGALGRKGLSENQWENQQTKSMKSQGYVQGEGGWYKPSEGAGGFGGIGKGLGMAGSFAAFYALFEEVGSLQKGAELNRQLDVLHQLIPAQKEYDETLKNITDTAKKLGLDVRKDIHQFIPFEMAAASQGVSLEESTKLFNALSVGIVGSGSQSQQQRIIADMTHMVLNADKLSLATIGRSDLGRYLGLVSEMEHQSGMGRKELENYLNSLSKEQQIDKFVEALRKWQPLADVAAQTTAGQYGTLHTNLTLLNADIEKLIDPSLNELFHSLNKIVEVMDQFVKAIQIVEKGISGVIPTPVKSFLQETLHNPSLMPFMSSGGLIPFAPTRVHVQITDKTSGGVKASPSKPSPNHGLTMARTR